MKIKRLHWGIWLAATVTIATFSGQAVITNAAILVHDENNILQNTKTAINTATTASNTARQVALAVQNLASMSSEGLVAHYLGVSEDMKQISEIVSDYKGLLKSTESAEQTWEQSFQDVNDLLDGKTSVSKYYGDRQMSLRALEKTYQDSLNVTKAISNIKKRAEKLEESILRSSNAIGTKEAVQANSQVSASQAAETLHTNEAVAQLVAMTAAKYAKENQDEAAAIAINQASAEALHEHVVKSKEEESKIPAWRQMYPPELQKFYED